MICISKKTECEKRNRFGDCDISQSEACPVIENTTQNIIRKKLKKESTNFIKKRNSSGAKYKAFYTEGVRGKVLMVWGKDDFREIFDTVQEHYSSSGKADDKIKTIKPPYENIDTLLNLRLQNLASLASEGNVVFVNSSAPDHTFFNSAVEVMKYVGKISDIKCPLCNTDMIRETLNKTNIWSCKKCPGILMEYFDRKNLQDLINNLLYKRGDSNE
ncbi:MAG: zf-TFIIB domain-containing protein [bacterium]